ncbi:MAG: histidine kinase dimerization/phosphoacceptor domain -containing protein [Syntrophothermus sp.]
MNKDLIPEKSVLLQKINELESLLVRYKSTLDNMLEGIAIINYDWTYIYVNNVNARHAHLKKEDMIGKKITDILQGFEKSEFYISYKTAMDERKFQQLEACYQFEDGTEEWYESIAHPIPEGIFVLTNDITKRKVAEIELQHTLKEKEMLLKELYHRTKNNMQLISSLLSLRGAAIQDEKYANAFLEMRNRIQAMSLVHERLYQTKSLSKLDLGLYIKDLVDLLIVSHSVEVSKIKVEYDLCDCEVMLDIAINCGLAVTELVLNVIKHAFPGDRKGVLKISLQNLGSNQMELKIADDGIGIPEDCLTKEDHLGFQVVRGLVEDQLDGNVNIESSHGTCWTIVFKNVVKEK